MQQRISNKHEPSAKMHLAHSKEPASAADLQTAKQMGSECQYDETAGHLVVKIVALLERVKISDLMDTSRGKAEICLARQMAMYLIHTVFSCPYHRVAKFFGRDRTTISHACKLVEDLRDNEPFDKSLETMENLLVSARALYEIVERNEAVPEGDRERFQQGFQRDSVKPHTSALLPQIAPIAKRLVNAK